MSEAVRRVNWLLVDLVVATGLAIDLVLESLLGAGVPDGHRLVTAIFAVPFAATIAARRRSAAAALVSCTALVLIQQLLHGQLVTTFPSESACLGPILCAYGLGAWLEPRRAAPPLMLSAVLLYSVAPIAAYAQHVHSAGGWTGGVGILIFFIVAPFAFGCLVRVRNRRAEAFVQLETQMIAERAERERAAIAEERVAIGRELQDIIAHSVSMMVVQAGGARRSLAQQPELARESILAVEETGREALAEMRRLLGVLRRDDDPRALAPQPGLEQLEDLISALGERGLRCDVGDEQLPALTPGVNLVAYRVLEAALSAISDSGAASADVRLASTRAELDLEVRAVGIVSQLQARLAGIAERVELYDGRLDVDVVSAQDATVTVRCRLPLSISVPA